jgi:small-conductance mechanosensitive channel
MQASNTAEARGEVLSFINDIANGQFLLSGGITSLLLIAALIILRTVLIRIMRGREEILSKDRRRWITNVKNTIWVALVIGLIFIWAPQIQTLALSLTAFAVALVIATKEFIMCLVGGLVRTSTRPFKIGNWITVNGVSGEVTDMDAFAVRLQEVDISGKTYQFTGQTFVIPNSVFLTAQVENLTFTKQYVYLDVPVTVKIDDCDPVKMMDRLKEITAKLYEPLHDEAGKFIRRIERKASVDLPDPEPHYFISAHDSGYCTFSVRLLAPTALATELSSAITLEFLSQLKRGKAL